MRNKTTHAKLLSLLLALAMVLSTAVTFAGVNDEPSDVNAPTAGEIDANQSENTDAPADTVVDANTNTDTSVDTDASVNAIENTKDVNREGEPVTISVTPTSIRVEVGKTETLTATSDPETEVVWSSSDESIATVDSDGVVSGVAVGTATITASAGEDESAPSATCTVTVFEKPAAPTIISASTRYGANDNGLTVKWEGTADKFILMRGTTPSNMANYKETTAKSLYWLEAKGTFYYAVKAVKGGVESDPSNIASVSISGNILTNIEDLVWYGHTKKKVSIYKTAKLKGKVATLPKGTYVIAMGKSPAKVKKFKQPSKVLVRTSDGRVGWLKYNQLKGGVKAATTVTYDYTKSAVEDFVNSHGYSSPNKYLIWVSPRTQRAYLLTGKKGHWTYYTNFRVTTGRFSHLTKPYHSAISQKKAKVFMVTEKGKRYYYKYASYFASGVSFHTGTWWKSNNKVRGVMNKKGVPQTFGCLRMANGDAEWIYNHIPINTTVIVKKDAYH